MKINNEQEVEELFANMKAFLSEVNKIAS